MVDPVTSEAVEAWAAENPIRAFALGEKIVALSKQPDAANDPHVFDGLDADERAILQWAGTHRLRARALIVKLAVKFGLVGKK